MKRSYGKLVCCLLIVVLVGCLAGCRQEEPAQQGTEASTKSQGEKALDSIGIGTASIGGALYAAGGGFAKIWKDLGVAASVEVTGGSVHNATLVDTGELGSAIISQGAAYQAMQGIGLFEGKKKHTNIRAALPLHSSYIYGWTLDKSITGYQDLKGRVVTGGPAGGTSDLYNKKILEIIGASPKKFVAASFADSTGLLRDGLVDAVVCSMGVPASATAEATASLNARVFGLGHGEEADKVIREMPFLYKAEIPANSYQGQTEPILTVADMNLYCFNKDIPEDVVYRFVKACFEQKEHLVNTLEGLKEMQPEKVSNIIIPLHPGAYKYYQEIGIKVPEKAMPVD